MRWPKKLNGHVLWESDAEFAFYYQKGAFGFAQAFEISVGEHKDNPKKTIVQVKYMSGNSWGRIPRNMKDEYTEDEVADIYTRTEVDKDDNDFEEYHSVVVDGKTIYRRGGGDTATRLFLSKYEPRTADKPYTLHYLICRCDYFPTLRRALDSLMGKTEIPKGKRKPRPIEPMTDEEIEEWSKCATGN